MRRPWTADETELLCEWVRAGKSDAVICRALRRTQWSVKSRRYTLGLDTAIAQGRPRVHCRKTIGAMLDAGVTRREICERLGLHKTTVARIAVEIR